MPDPARSIRDGAIAPWNTPSHRDELERFLGRAPRLGMPTDVPFADLTPEQVATVVDGSAAKGYPGLRGFFEKLEAKAYKVQVRVFLSRWRGYQTCPACDGRRLRPEALAVRVGGLDIAALSALTVRDALAFLGRVAGEEAGNAGRRRVIDQARGGSGRSTGSAWIT